MKKMMVLMLVPFLPFQSALGDNLELGFDSKAAICSAIADRFDYDSVDESYCARNAWTSVYGYEEDSIESNWRATFSFEGKLTPTAVDYVECNGTIRVEKVSGAPVDVSYVTCND